MWTAFVRHINENGLHCKLRTSDVRGMQVSYRSGGRCIRCAARNRNSLLAVRAERFAESDQHSQHIFGKKGYVAGIPISTRQSGCGLRLKVTLEQRPHEFVEAALKELEVSPMLPAVATAGNGTLAALAAPA